jgi:hypothetical protein
MINFADAVEGEQGSPWFEEANAAEETLNRSTRLSRNEVRDAMSLAGRTQWALLPGSEPGDCRRFLMVLVDEGLGHNATDRSIQLVFERRLEQARIYVNRISPATEGILFVLARSHFTWAGGWQSPAQMFWREAWCRYRTILTQDRPDLRLRVSFLNRIREGRRGCHFDRDGSPVGGRLLLDWWEKARDPVRELFRQRVRLLRHLGVEPDLDCRFYEFIGSDQPEGCNHLPALDFGASFRGNMEGTGIAARMYLAPELDLPIAFPASRYNRANGMAIVQAPHFASIGEPLWRPEDMTLFAKDPQLWLARNKAFF